MAYSINNRPKSPEELFRNVLERLERLENARSTRVGDWGLKQDSNGRIVAVHARSGRTIVIAE